jgi:catechol 2,3-dioxygenase-like lactoylglutathione lyase family enzyme
MSIRLNHTIVAARDKQAAASFLTEILGLPAAQPAGPFLAVQVDNDVTLDFMDAQGEIESQHYAFLVGEEEFDAILGRIASRDLRYWADPSRKKRNQVRHRDGARAVYFDDPSGHLLEILTLPSAGAQAS